MRRSTAPVMIFLASLSALGWSVTQSVSGQVAGPQFSFLRTFIQLDVNGDQTISRGEVPESVRDCFDTLIKHGDLDGNGQLAADELRSLGERIRQAGPYGPPEGIAAMFQQRFRQADRDGDGKISREEFPNGRQAFDRLDVDGDGFITPLEARQRLLGLGNSGGTGQPLQIRLRELDRNRDGSISRDEYRGPPALFDRLDRNGDGTIGPAEIGQSNQGNPPGPPQTREASGPTPPRRRSVQPEPDLAPR